MTAFILTVIIAATAAADAPASKPNIIVILADDYGWGSVGCYGVPSDVKTPNLDRLAKEGRRFTNAYAPGSVCSPTRYGLMTGRYYWRTSVKDGEVLGGNAPLHIEPGRITLASLCKSQGYNTAAFGKWHLGMGTEPRRSDWSTSLAPGPEAIGFEYFFGMGSNPWSGPHSFIENGKVLGAIPGMPIVVSGNREGATTAGIKQAWKEEEIMKTLTERVVGWIEKQAADKPFFVYYAPNAIHRPISPNPRFSGSPYGPYGDFIHELDWSVGEILRVLDRQKLADNTLVIFTSDNGGVAVDAPDAIGVAKKAGLKVNGPLRGGKHDEWEGGFREPFLVRWLGKVPAGTVSEQVICHTDVLATLASILKSPLPAAGAEDSFDALRAFTEETPGRPVRDHVIMQSAHVTYAIRQGDWKLVERKNGPPISSRAEQKAAKKGKAKKAATGEDELFNLKDDPSETNNVIAQYPEIASKLKRLLAMSRDQGHTRSDARP
jgi:arylsulfatase A